MINLATAVVASCKAAFETMSGQKLSSKRSLSESSADDFVNKSNETYTKCENIKSKRNDFTNSSGQNEKNQLISNAVDFAIRVILVIVFICLETTPPFVRKILPEELWRYKNPRTDDFVSPKVLFSTVVFGPLLTTLLYFLKTGDKRDFISASWTWTLTIGLNGLATSLLKLTVGRPRPDFFYRCFPDGILVLSNITGQIDDGRTEYLNCTGTEWDISEGRKSFPSGHSSFAFASYGFIAFYAAAKLHVFSGQGRGQSWRLCIAITPLLLAALVAVSRTCDYHHHWEDVFIGSIIGILTSYMVYRQYYPSIFENSERSNTITNNWSQTKVFPNELKKSVTPYHEGKDAFYDDDLLNSDDHRPLLSIRAETVVSPNRRLRKL